VFEWILGTIGVLVISTAGIQIGRGFYYLGCFKTYNRLCKVCQKCWYEVVEIFHEEPIVATLYVTMIAAVLMIAIYKI
jgi:hypothetical protein